MTTTRNARFTGITTGPVETDPQTGEQFQVIAEYDQGECIDRYVTMVRTERMILNGHPA